MTDITSEYLRGVDLIEFLGKNSTEQAAEIERLSAAKTAALKVADERTMQNTALRQENERLRALLSDAASIIDDAQSGYISGCSNDLAWDGRREDFLQAARNAEQEGDGP